MHLTSTTSELILGIELTCADKNHVVGIFDGTDDTINKIKNWIKEYILSPQDGTYWTSIQVMDQINKWGGIPYIAHLDTSNMFKEKKYLSGAYKKMLFSLPFFNVIGLSDKNKKDKIEALIKSYKKEFCYVVDEDSHEIDTIGTNVFWIKGHKRNFAMIKGALRDHSISLEYDNPKTPDNFIKGILVKKRDTGFLKGDEQEDFCLSFSESLNCFIGGRGTGKSTVLQIIEFVLKQKYDREETLDFICNNDSIWILFSHQNEEYMLCFHPPIKDYPDDSILKYFTDDRWYTYRHRYQISSDKVAEYTLKNYITIQKIKIQDDKIMTEVISNKATYFEKFFNIKYSMNELVKTASSDMINDFIYRTIFRNEVLANPASDIRIRSKNGLKTWLIDVQDIIEQRRTKVMKVVNEFNTNQDGILRIRYMQNEKKVEMIDFERLLSRSIDMKNGKFYKKYNILKERVVEYLEDLTAEFGIQKLLLMFFEKNYEELNSKVEIKNLLEQRTQSLIEKGIIFVEKQKEEIELIRSIVEDFVCDDNIYDIIKYLKNYITEIESFSLEFNMNSKESTQSNAQNYRDVRELSLGQKVVAMLSFVLGYSDYSKDFTPLIIDQPEDNLDSQYIYKNLVKQLRDIKLKRQVIIATHNATIVTNAKAEQVIVMESDNLNGWAAATGYPNEKNIKKHIINYLEGGIESFLHKCFIYDEILKE